MEGGHAALSYLLEVCNETPLQSIPAQHGIRAHYYHDDAVLFCGGRYVDGRQQPDR